MDDRGAWTWLLRLICEVLAAAAVGGVGRAVVAVVVGKGNVRPQHVGFLELFHGYLLDARPGTPPAAYVPSRLLLDLYCKRLARRVGWCQCGSATSRARMASCRCGGEWTVSIGRRWLSRSLMVFRVRDGACTEWNHPTRSGLLRCMTSRPLSICTSSTFPLLAGLHFIDACSRNE